MKFELVELFEFSGNKSAIYSIRINGEEDTLFDKFINENDNFFPDEIEDILITLEQIGYVSGAKEPFFKFNEGALGDGVCALFDNPDRKLRLYCIRYGTTTIILGGGGAKNVRALQEDPKLKHENYLLRKISKVITTAIKEKDISWHFDGKRLQGQLIFEDDE